MSNRIEPKKRRRQLLNSAVEIARDEGFQNLTRQAIADAAGVSPGLVTVHLGTMSNLKRSVMRAGVAREIHEIISYGIAINHPITNKMSAEKRAVTVAWVNSH